MGYLNEEQMADGSSVEKTVAPGSSANVILTEYTPFKYGVNKDRTMPQHKGKDADTGEELTFTGFAFHDCVKSLNDSIIPGMTVVQVKCLDNGTKYPDYELSVVTGAAKTEEKPF